MTEATCVRACRLRPFQPNSGYQSWTISQLLLLLLFEIAVPYSLQIMCSIACNPYTCSPWTGLLLPSVHPSRSRWEWTWKRRSSKIAMPFRSNSNTIQLDCCQYETELDQNGLGWTADDITRIYQHLEVTVTSQ